MPTRTRSGVRVSFDGGRGGEGGFALVITLIVTALLIALTAEFVNEVYVDTSARQNFIDGQQASLLAESGIAGGIKILQLTLAANQTYTSLRDRWAGPLQVEDERGSLQIVIEDESGKINLNSVVNPNGTPGQYHPATARLLKKFRLPGELLDALTDWIDTNEEPQRGGAETGYYQGLKPPYAAKNSRLDSLEELRLVRGFNAGAIDRLKSFVTIYSEDDNVPAQVNINTAPAEVLAALDDQMTDSLVENILTYRKSTPFRSPADLVKVPGMESIGPNLATSTTVVGKVFRLTSLARVNETTRVIEAVVRPNASQVLYWREF